MLKKIVLNKNLKIDLKKTKNKLLIIKHQKIILKILLNKLIPKHLKYNYKKGKDQNKNNKKVIFKNLTKIKFKIKKAIII